MPAFEILPASWRDLGELRRLEHDCFKEDAWPLWDLIGVLTLPDVVRLKAVREDKMVGFAGGEINRREGIGWVTTMGVHSAYRRQGIGRALLFACEDALGLSRLRLCVRWDNQAAQELYRSAGYRQVDIWKSYYPSGQDALVMEKNR
jgi:ribosomal-protein-alanine N-acetyltransferase